MKWYKRVLLTVFYTFVGILWLVETILSTVCGFALGGLILGVASSLQLPLYWFRALSEICLSAHVGPSLAVVLSVLALIITSVLPAVGLVAGAFFGAGAAFRTTHDDRFHGAMAEVGSRSWLCARTNPDRVRRAAEGFVARSVPAGRGPCDISFAKIVLALPIAAVVCALASGPATLVILLRRPEVIYSRTVAAWRTRPRGCCGSGSSDPSGKCGWANGLVLSVLGTLIATPWEIAAFVIMILIRSFVIGYASGFRSAFFTAVRDVLSVNKIIADNARELRTPDGDTGAGAGEESGALAGGPPDDDEAPAADPWANGARRETIDMDVAMGNIGAALAPGFVHDVIAADGGVDNQV
eukprot:TRINITY_DN17055_c0_g1_i1.p1 TRINITY_DN17055_c0_g1~~TRINITY_DN17055_c0_g1_i1.p1  ORF type:complete len:355 (+),score=136.65 TRINITY_DN17055_c0_g1_i1:146-1210(+)